MSLPLYTLLLVSLAYMSGCAIAPTTQRAADLYCVGASDAARDAVRDRIGRLVAPHRIEMECYPVLEAID